MVVVLDVPDRSTTPLAGACAPRTSCPSAVRLPNTGFPRSSNTQNTVLPRSVIAI